MTTENWQTRRCARDFTDEEVDFRLIHDIKHNNRYTCPKMDMLIWWVVLDQRLQIQTMVS